METLLQLALMALIVAIAFSAGLAAGWLWHQRHFGENTRAHG